jgi:hypothetical protein
MFALEPLLPSGEVAQRGLELFHQAEHLVCVEGATHNRASLSP